MQNTFQVVTASLTLGAAGLLLGAGSASALTPPTVPVLVNGTTYDVTYFEGAYDENISRFTTAEMPWWGDSGLANTFATAIGDDLGLSVFNFGGPGFAFAEQAKEDEISGGVRKDVVLNFYDSAFPGVIKSSSSSPSSFPCAILTPQSLAPVPALLPLFGAAAAFRATRRLRSMRRTLHRSTTAGS
jgi:hypothetical protein